jgi:hypothetical protein
VDNLTLVDDKAEGNDSHIGRNTMETNSEELTRFQWYFKNWFVYNISTLMAVILAPIFYIFILYLLIFIRGGTSEIDGPSPILLAMVSGLFYIPIGNIIYILLSITEAIIEPADIINYRQITIQRLLRYSVAIPFILPPLVLLFIAYY